ncbi:hypothetical protein [Nocardioides mesophilus]|nr:hypothetical protein [Nocardioides mesophilus]
MVVRVLQAATVVALAVAIVTPHKPTPEPAWVDEICARVDVC